VIKNRNPKHRELTNFIASQADAWRKAKIKAWNGSLALAYLPWESPRQYLWTVKNLEVLIFNFLNTDLPEAQLNELALCLLQRGAVVVRYVHLNSNNKMKIFRREGASNDTTA
ncbi:MAG: hypothetical protein K5Q00_03225, partial [Gammaproteobacteria bacterium]|nr:hypothetical protein [Gammaproteobacteria bacterium]